MRSLIPEQPKGTHAHTHFLSHLVLCLRVKRRELQVTDLKSRAQYLCNQGIDNQSLRDEVISLVTLSCKYYKYSCSRTQWPGLGGWMLSTALSQGSPRREVLTGPYCLRDCWGEARPEGDLGKLGLRALTCRRRAWPSTYFPGGLVWAGTGPDAARTAAGRFATRQEKSVDSTQFRPSILPRRMFPSMPALSFYSLSSSFRCLCAQRGVASGRVTEAGSLLCLCHPRPWVSGAENEDPLGSSPLIPHK